MKILQSLSKLWSHLVDPFDSDVETSDLDVRVVKELDSLSQKRRRFGCRTLQVDWELTGRAKDLAKQFATGDVSFDEGALRSIRGLPTAKFQRSDARVFILSPDESPVDLLRRHECDLVTNPTWSHVGLSASVIEHGRLCSNGMLVWVLVFAGELR